MPGYTDPQEDPLSLSNNHSSAFQMDDFEPDTGTYFNFGPLFLQRQRLSHNEIAVFEPGIGSNPTGGVPVPKSDAGPSFDAIPIQRYELFHQDFNPALGGSLGYYWNGQSIEAAGFFMFQRRDVQSNSTVGQLDSFFFNAPPQFAGDNGLWRQADIITSTFKQQLASAELNYRATNQAVWEGELIFGIRYVDQIESVTIYTDEDSVSFPNALTNQLDQATFQVQTKNRMVGLQTGMEFNQLLCSWLQVGGIGKVAVGPNFTEVDAHLQRGDGLLGFDTRSYNAHWFSQVYDVKLTADWMPLDRFRLRVGYNALWLVGVTEAANQVNFNLANPLSNAHHTGSIFYQGPSLELMFFF